MSLCYVIKRTITNLEYGTLDSRLRDGTQQ